MDYDIISTDAWVNLEKSQKKKDKQSSHKNIFQVCSICGQPGHNKTGCVGGSNKRRCSMCRQILDLSKFSKGHYHCKTCTNTHTRKHDTYLKSRSVEDCFRSILKAVIYSGKKRNLQITIDLPFLMSLLKQQNGRCYYTGRTLTPGRGNNAISIDRLDSDLGYISGNVVLACWAANQAKSDLTELEFIQLCQDVVNYRVNTLGEPHLDVEDLPLPDL